MDIKEANNNHHTGGRVVDLDALSAISADYKRDGKTVVLSHGTFDLLHPGHLRHFADAHKQGDILIVSLTADSFINKGPGRPVFNETLRAEAVAAVRVVDYVAVVYEASAVAAIETIRPNIYAKGSDYSDPERDITGKIYDEIECVKKYNGQVYFTDEITFSSSNLINTHLSVFPPETTEWLKSFREQYSEDDVISWLHKIDDLKVLVIGEAIIDEYVFVQGMGKVSKDPILAFLYQNEESQLGGTLAIANHVGGISKNCSLVTVLGEKGSDKDLITDNLRPKVNLLPVIQPNAQTLLKRRFVDIHTGVKVFELYLMEDTVLSDETENDLLSKLEKPLAEADVVIVADYGHEMMTPAIIDAVCASKAFLVVNTQANAGNLGFNYITKYTRADYICISGYELKLAMRKRHISHNQMLAELASEMNCDKLTVTLGKSGTLHHSKDGGFYTAPALAMGVVDRVGAGDAVLSITGLLAAVGAPWPIIGLIANLAGASLVSSLGTKTFLSSPELQKQIMSLLK